MSHDLSPFESFLFNGKEGRGKSRVYELCKRSTSLRELTKIEQILNDRTIMENQIQQGFQTVRNPEHKRQSKTLVKLLEIERTNGLGMISPVYVYSVLINRDEKEEAIKVVCKKFSLFFQGVPGLCMTQCLRNRGKFEAHFYDEFQKILKTNTKCSVPKVHFYDHKSKLLATEFVPGKTLVSNRKNMLKHAEILGNAIGIYQSRTYGFRDNWYRPLLRKEKLRYYSRSWLHELYYGTASLKMQSFVDETLSAETSLCHGDLSPKNVIESNEDRLMIIDLERANYEDPAEDPATWLNYYFLRVLVRELSEKEGLSLIRKFMRSYRKAIANSVSMFKDLDRIELRIPKIIGALLLYRTNAGEMSGIQLDSYLKQKMKSDALLAFKEEYNNVEEYFKGLSLGIKGGS